MNAQSLAGEHKFAIKNIFIQWNYALALARLQRTQLHTLSDHDEDSSSKTVLRSICIANEKITKNMRILLVRIE